LEQKISFSVENAEMVTDNPESAFAVLSLDFFASGQNLHNMYVSEETLMKTADSIKNCPVVWKYDETLDDIFTHDKDEVPCGFVPENSLIKSRTLSDGRTMLSVVAYVWKKYTGELLSFFKRDGGKKPVSVEMSVFGREQRPDGNIELTDFRYEGITLLGTYVTPAIPLANATVLSFAHIKEEYEEAIKKEFSIFDVDMTIPAEIKDTVKKAIDENNKTGTSAGLSTARYLLSSDKISLEKVKSISKYFSINENAESITWSLYGGDTTKEWISSLLFKIEENTKNKLEFAKVISEPPENSEKMEKTMEKEPKTEDMAEVPTEDMAEAPAPKEKVNPAEEKLSPEDLAKIRDTKKEEKKFEFPKNFDMEAMGKMFAEEDFSADNDEDDVKMAKLECEKKEFADPKVLMSGMFAKMCKMAKKIVEMSEASKVTMADNEELKKFKADFEAQQKAFEVEKTLKELGDKVVLSAEAKEEMMAEAEKFSLAEISTWVTNCKAKSFEFAVKENNKPDVVRVGMPFTASAPKKNNDLWAD
jgi:hypothetical protein